MLLPQEGAPSAKELFRRSLSYDWLGRPEERQGSEELREEEEKGEEEEEELREEPPAAQGTPEHDLQQKQEEIDKLKAELSSMKDMTVKDFRKLFEENGPTTPGGGWSKGRSRGKGSETGKNGDKQAGKGGGGGGGGGKGKKGGRKRGRGKGGGGKGKTK